MSLHASRRGQRGIGMAVLFLAATVSRAADYDRPLYETKIDEGRGRVTDEIRRVVRERLPNPPPSVLGVLSLDPHRSIAYVNRGRREHALVVFDPENGAVSLVDIPELAAEYPSVGFLGGYPMGAESGLTVVALQAHRDDTTHGIQNETTWLILFVFDDRGLVARSKPVEIERTDLAPPHGGEKAAWFFVTGDSLESGREARGTASFSRFLVRDVNGDRFPDVILWRKNFAARARGTPPKASPHALSQYLEAGPDDLRVMTWDPATRSFSGPSPGRKLPVPNDALWDGAPSSGYWLH